MRTQPAWLRRPEPPLHVDSKCWCCGQPAKVINGSWFRWHREGKGMSLREAARRAGLSAAFVSDFERGRRAWSDRLGKAYGISLRGIRLIKACA